MLKITGFLALAVALVVALSGCATSNDVAMAKAHYDAQSETPPLFHLEAQPGETIQLSGVASLTVSAPSDVQQYRMPKHPVWSVIGDAANIVLPIAAQGATAYNVANVVGQHAGNIITGSNNTDIDASDRSTQDNRRWSNEGRIESPDDSTHSPTVVEQPEPVVVDPPPAPEASGGDS